SRPPLARLQRQLPLFASLKDSMKRGTIRSRTISGPFEARYSPAAAAASSAAGISASRAASHPPERTELRTEPASPPDAEPPLPEFEPRCDSALFAAKAATLVAAAAAAALTAVPLPGPSPPCCDSCCCSSTAIIPPRFRYERDFARAELEVLPLRELLPPPLSSSSRLISASLTVLNVPAAASACSLISSASFTSLSKLALFLISPRSWSTRVDRSSATCSTSFSEAILALLSVDVWFRLSPSRPVSFPTSQQVSERPEIDVEVTIFELEMFLELLHPLIELHERLPHALDLVVRQRPRLHPP